MADTTSPAAVLAKAVANSTKDRIEKLMQKFEQAGVLEEVKELLQLQTTPVAMYYQKK